MGDLGRGMTIDQGSGCRDQSFECGVQGITAPRACGAWSLVSLISLISLIQYDKKVFEYM